LLKPQRIGPGDPLGLLKQYDVVQLTNLVEQDPMLLGPAARWVFSITTCVVPAPGQGYTGWS
jgi:hypothetical protein